MRYIDNECERDDREIMREGESESGKKGGERERVRWREQLSGRWRERENE